MPLVSFRGRKESEDIPESQASLASASDSHAVTLDQNLRFESCKKKRFPRIISANQSATVFPGVEIGFRQQL